MSQWETIQDKSSHISPVKRTMPRDYSSERVDDVFEAIYKTTYTQTTKTVKTTTASTPKKSNQYVKRLLRIGLGAFLIFLTACQFQCTIDPSKSELCKYRLDIQPQHTIGNMQRIATDYCQQLNFKWPIAQYDYAKKYYTEHLGPSMVWIREYLDAQWHDFHHQLEKYIESGRPKSAAQDTFQKDDTFKATAKRILDYFEKSDKHRQEDAKAKAKKILNGLFEERNERIEQVKEAPVDDTNKVTYEIQAIMHVAQSEKAVLNEQLSLIQSNIQKVKSGEQEDGEDARLLIQAIKYEIEELRMKAEHRIRERAKSAIESIHHDNPVVNQHIKEDLLLAQRAALKDLRQIYIKLYETNKMIDGLT